jgi:hypothetical protein
MCGQTISVPLRYFVCIKTNFFQNTLILEGQHVYTRITICTKWRSYPEILCDISLAKMNSAIHIQTYLPQRLSATSSAPIRNYYQL